ncbi:MAG: hypothetical protein HYX84_04595 [Chloroflexi bacterium]|nr:hypothetical protein [Chloroflexota bacterium]
MSRDLPVVSPFGKGGLEGFQCSKSLSVSLYEKEMKQFDGASGVYWSHGVDSRSRVEAQDKLRGNDKDRQHKWEGEA